MSGIILPGQNKPSQGGGAQGGGSGIELPKGFSSRRAEPEPETPAEEAPGAQAPDAGAAAPERQGRRSRASDMLFPPTGAQVQCPNCGTPYVVPVFTIVDLGANPELLGALLGGQLNVAVCPQCGAGGPLSAPLMVHDPGHEFLGVYTPPVGMDDIQRQKIIGDLTQALMRKLPQDQRRGYMLQPKQYMDWQRFIERLWEFQGVTPEMLRRQRMQTEALQSLMRLADDPSALDIALERSRDLIDRQFFSLLDRLMIMVSQQGDQQGASQMMALRTALLEKTEAGREIKVLQDRIRAVLEAIPPDATREDVLDKLLEAWDGENGREIGSSVVMALGPMLDYHFLLAISNRLEQTTDEATRARLEELRNLVIELQEQQRQDVQSVAAQAQEVLQAILEAEDVDAALAQYGDMIDESLLGLLANNIDRAEKSGATAAVRRLREIYDKALDMLQANMPPELRLINQLVNAPDKAAVRRLLEENRSALTHEFIDALRQLEEDFRGRGGADVADRLKSVRAQAQLMM
jgi:hypothetical protein